MKRSSLEILISILIILAIRGFFVLFKGGRREQPAQQRDEIDEIFRINEEVVFVLSLILLAVTFVLWACMD